MIITNDALHSLFFAQVMGLYLVITAVIMLSRADYYKSLLTHLKAGSAAVVATACFSLILGLSLVVVHNLWIWESEVLVTLVAWLILIKSVLWLSIPEQMVEWTKKIYGGPGYYVVAVLAFMVGAILMSHGFYLFSDWGVVI